MKSRSGFTIVELLIVIVVIAILAAISVVAYNGIQERTENTKTIQAVSQYAKIIMSYAATYGNYPIDTGNPCLSESGTYCARVSGTTNCFGGGATGSNVNYIAELKKIVTTLPQASSQRIPCNGAEYTGVHTVASTGSTSDVYYFLKGNQACEGIGGAVSYMKQQQEGLTRCRASLPTLP